MYSWFHLYIYINIKKSFVLIFFSLENRNVWINNCYSFHVLQIISIVSNSKLNFIYLYTYVNMWLPCQCNVISVRETTLINIYIYIYMPIYKILFIPLSISFTYKMPEAWRWYRLPANSQQRAKPNNSLPDTG